MNWTPRPEQALACDFMLHRSYCALFLGMGMGKTSITLSVIDHLMYEEFCIDKVLIVAPLRVARSTWTDEIEKWSFDRLRVSRILGSATQRINALKKDADIYIINRDNLAWLVSQYQTTNTIRKVTWPFDTLVLDELSSYKNRSSLRSKQIRLIRPQCRRVIGLTGTPAPKGLIDLWSQVFLIDLGKSLGRSLGQYRDMHFLPGARGGNVVYDYILKPGHDTIIMDQLRDTCLSLRTEDYNITEKFTVNRVYVDMPFEVLKAYQKFKRDRIMEIIHSGETITASTAATLRIKLLQYANGAIYVDNETEGRNRDWVELHTEKLDALEEIFEEAQGAPVFVAWAYRHDRDRIMRRFKKRGCRDLITVADERDWNAGEIPMALVHPASISYGLNLQAGGSIIVWFGLTDSLELYQQLNARLERPGQKRPGFIHTILTRGTEDTRVIERLEQKNSTQEALLNGLKPDQDDLLNEIKTIYTQYVNTHGN